MSLRHWFEVENPELVFSPGLLVYQDRVAQNIDLMVTIAGNVDRLIPHVKTHKMAEVVRMQLAAGITKFKCATIAEAEMLADAGAKWVLIAYQLVGPNVARLDALKAKHPEVHFASLVDSLPIARRLSESAGATASVFIDINNGMNRSGTAPDASLLTLYQAIKTLPNLEIEGLHVYDGHIREADFAARKAHSDQDFTAVEDFMEVLRENGLPSPMIVAGGSPTFNVHAQRPGIFLSPGTCLLWDWGYGDRFLDQPFQHAAVLVTRVISKPAENIITVDLGHKAVSAENPIDRRFRFLNLDGYEILSQSEEHGVVRVEDWEAIQVGDLLYAIPYHICPTVALHSRVQVVENRKVTDQWPVVARTRMISV